MEVADHISPRIPVIQWSDREICEEAKNFINGGYPETKDPWQTMVEVILELDERGLKLEDECVVKDF